MTFLAPITRVARNYILQAASNYEALAYWRNRTQVEVEIFSCWRLSYLKSSKTPSSTRKCNNSRCKRKSTCNKLLRSYWRSSNSTLRLNTTALWLVQKRSKMDLVNQILTNIYDYRQFCWCYRYRTSKSSAIDCLPVHARHASYSD
jgi:hypothetical protein